MPIVHGVPLSPFVRKVLIVLEEKGIAYDNIPVVPFGVSDEYKQKSPLGKIPCYEDGDFILPDSSVIAAYLEKKHPQPALYPTAPQEYAKALWFEEYADSKMMQEIGTVFVQRIVNPRFLNQPTDQAAVDTALNEGIPVVFRYLENALGDADALVGGTFSIADIAVAAVVRQLQIAGETVDANAYPKLARYITAIHSRPVFQKRIEAENSMIPQ